MANKMLIDASHPEETRVVVLRDQRVEEFDFEAAFKKPLRGNIYLAKVTRVEPSLQAAFVDYGGNRHGFLAFSEIHPDYYQIPVADRLALLEDVAAEAAEEEEEEEERRPRRSRRHRGRTMSRGARGREQDDALVADVQNSQDPNGDISVDSQTSAGAETNDLVDFASAKPPLDADGTDWRSGSKAQEVEPDPVVRALGQIDEGEDANEASSEGHGAEREKQTHASTGEPPHVDDPGASSREESLHDLEAHPPIPAESARDEQLEFFRDPRDGADIPLEDAPDLKERRPKPSEAANETDHDARKRAFEEEGEEEEDDSDSEDEDEGVEQIGGDALEEMPMRKPRMRRQYKIQEVIKRRQVLLVQVVKEERGNKGAALTTFLSLAGRYSVLMPNTARGGGISRKITDAGDRKRLKEIAQELDVPEGMGVILRTAGAARTRAEVKRDFEYLLRMWETVRESTLRSSAPTLVYEEGSLIKRAIRDLYNRDVDEIIVSGDEGFREARNFMRLLMPSHLRNVKPWREQEGLFVRAGVETQLDSMFSPQVTLRSGGYLVINQTEALVAIDVNSGRSTREHNIEDTAVRTNLEAADEVARQLRLRDLAGLIVVDFIDMEEPRNNRAVERRLKEALKNDRARIQVGRISHFGLLEMSRQRIRAGLVEGSTAPCPHCSGAGTVRSVSSIALHVLRVLEESLNRSATHNIIVRTRAHVAFYILNQKRAHLRDIENRYGVDVYILSDDTLTGSSYHALERGEPATGSPRPRRETPVSAFEPEFDANELDEDGLEALDEAAEREPDPRKGRTARDTMDEDDSENGRRRRRRRRRRSPIRGEKDENFIGASSAPADAGGESEAPYILENGAGQWSEPGEGQWTREDSQTPQPFAAPSAILPLPQNRQLTSDSPALDSSMESPRKLADRIESENLEEPAQTPAPETGFSNKLEAQAASHPPLEQTPPDGDPAHQPARGEAADTAVKHQEIEAAPAKPYEKVITAADPKAPKKGGWWQRAKASLTGQ